MNLGGGASNVDLSEAARLLKQSTGGGGVPNQAAMQPPPLSMMMQQAVAMQQFQFQQALLMQQVMATQQAAARAATVKSAAEIASARAAEISKQLKGSDAEGDEEKKSPGRSKSRSASRSPSHSRSKSRSPIRYRRDRSASRSPIRYRRDARLSPPRSRDYYSYRSRSRRGYYRGRGDYSWNPSFRRDWDRDRERDHYSRSSRRSRSRSRSRVRRRSRTHSRSPRGRRDRSVTPPRYHRDDRRFGRSVRRSRSREVKPSPSHSSRSLSESPRGRESSRSPPRKGREFGSSGGLRKGHSLSPVIRGGRRASSGSPAQEDQSDRLEREDKSESKGADAGIMKKAGKAGISMSSPRSLSVSLSPKGRSPRKLSEADEDENGLSGLKKSLGPDTGKSEGGIGLVEKAQGTLTGTRARVSSTDGFSEQENGSKGGFKAKGGEFIGRQGRQMRREDSGKAGLYGDDDSDEDKELDDWRDDIKAHERDRLKRKETKLEAERRVDEEKRGVKGHIAGAQEVGRAAVLPQGQIVKGNEEVSFLQIDPLDNFGPDAKATGGIESKKFEFRKLKDRDFDVSEEVRGDEHRSKKGSEGDGEKDREMLDIADEGRGEQVKTAGKVEEYKREKEASVIFEGPKLAHEVTVEMKEGGTAGKFDNIKELNFKGGKNARGNKDDDEEVGAQHSELLDEEEIPGFKVKEKSKSRERTKRHDNDAERDRRKDRHRKHRRKHRRGEEENEKEDNEEDEDKEDAEGRKDKEERRHRRKHRSRDTAERDRKKRKHKHHGRSASESPGKDSPIVEVEGGQHIAEADSPVRKKSSGSHGKRRREPSKSPAHSGSTSE